jgi:ATP-dependent RNA helicase DeaD
VISATSSELNLLIDVLKKSLVERNSKSIIVFCDTKKSVDKVCDALQKAEIKSLSYYHEISMQGRTMTNMLFQNGELPVLVATNLAARGLDTNNVSHVV